MKHAEAAEAVGLFACAGLPPSKLRDLAYETGFCQRASGKIQASSFLVHLCLESIEGTVSCNDLAARIHARTGVDASRQAYWERTNDRCVEFFQRVLECVLLSKCRPAELAAVRRHSRFKRLLVQDSTIIQLPLRLLEAFSGVQNAHAAVCNARIQGIYDLLAGRFVQFSVDSYSRNDLTAALDIRAQPGDLILRDRGYFRVAVIAAHRLAGADTITRYKHPTILFDPTTGDRLDLLKLLTRYGSLDREVLADASQKARLRLVAIPVAEETANLRRMKAHQEIKGRVPSQEVLRLMSWTIFLTTLTDPAITPKDLLALYGMRWRIECIFKTWKTNFNFAKLHNVSAIQLRVLLNARLIMITLAYQNLFLPLSRRLRLRAGRHLSLMKFMRYLSRNLGVLPALLDPARLAAPCAQALVRYCAYEKRRRSNFALELEIALARTETSPA